MLYKHQIEVTTRCNYSCWYCAGRHMPQQDMEWSIFTEIADRIPAGEFVNLQGEGEPTLWPHWWDGVRYLVARGVKPYAIINGSRVEPELFAEFFPTLGITIDTLDAEEAETIGRHNLKKMLANLEALLALMPNRITVHTVHAGGSKMASKVIAWAVANGCKFRLHQLQTKEDYSSVYPQIVVQRVLSPKPGGYRCSFLESGEYHYYTVTGKRLPCCFIKFQAEEFDAENARKMLSENRTVPQCMGCRVPK